MLLDAIVLAGGRSSRLLGVPKSQLPWRGTTLLQNTIDAALRAGARQVVVVGPDASGSVPRIQFAREDPPFGGPAAAVAAGIRALAEKQPPAADGVFVLACDMPNIAGALAVLVDSLPMLESGDGDGSIDGEQDGVGRKGRYDGVIMLDSSGRRQPLAAVYGRPALAGAIAALRASESLDGASMRSLTSSLALVELADFDESTRDVDTWDDAAAFGIEQSDAPMPPRTQVSSPHKKESRMSDVDSTDKPAPAKPARSESEKADMLAALERWSASLSAELGIADLEIDVDALLALAGVAAHAVLRPAAPLTTYLVGYAAGRAAALDQTTAARATARASEIASDLARRHEK